MFNNYPPSRSCYIPTLCSSGHEECLLVELFMFEDCKALGSVLLVNLCLCAVKMCAAPARCMEMVIEALRAPWQVAEPMKEANP